MHPAQLYSGEISDYDKFRSDLVLLRHFAAIATVADAMPLLSINHYIVKEMLHFMNYINPFDKSDEIVRDVCYDGFVQNVYNNFHIFINKLIGKSNNDFDMEFLEYTVIPVINSIKRMSAGSVRCPHTYPFLSKVNQSGMAYCAGHECGIAVIADKLHLFFDFLLHEFDGMFQTKDICDISKGRKKFLGMVSLNH